MVAVILKIQKKILHLRRNIIQKFHHSHFILSVIEFIFKDLGGLVKFNQSVKDLPRISINIKKNNKA